MSIINVTFLLFFNIRNLFFMNFMIRPHALVYNKKLIHLSGFYNLIYYFIKSFPFNLIKILFNFFNINIIYKVDSIYNITGVSNNYIMPIVLEFIVIKNDNSLTLSNIKYYNSSIPLSFILINNKLFKYDKIKVKYLNKGKIKEDVLYINDYYNEPLYKLFIENV
jgi:hypothetical protein